LANCLFIRFHVRKRESTTTSRLSKVGHGYSIGGIGRLLPIKDFPNKVKNIPHMKFFRLKSHQRKVLFDEEEISAPHLILRGHEGAVNGVVCLSNGRLVSYGWDSTLRLWSPDGTLIKMMEAGPNLGGVTKVIALDDGSFLSLDFAICHWSQEGKRIKEAESYHWACFSDILMMQNLWVSWGGDGVMKLWSPLLKRPRNVDAHSSQITSIKELGGGRFLTTSLDGELKIWSPRGKLEHTLEGHPAGVAGAILSSAGNIISWDLAGNIGQWDQEGRHLSWWNGHDDAINGMCLLPDKSLLSWSADATLRIWKEEEPELTVLKGHQGSIANVYVFGDSSFLSWCGDFPPYIMGVRHLNYDNILFHWPFESDGGGGLEFHTSHVNGVLELSRNRLLSWSNDHTLCGFDLNGVFHFRLKGHEDRVTGALLHPDGRIVSWSEDGTVRIWK